MIEIRVGIIGIVTTLLTLGIAPHRVGFVMAAMVLSLGLASARVRRKRRAEARATAQMVGVICAELAEDLRAGQVPAAALAAAAEQWPPMSSAATAAKFGQSIPREMRLLASRPGADGLRAMASAWKVSAESGSALADVLDTAGRGLAAKRRLERLIDADIAAVRASALVVSALPVLVNCLGAGLGTDAWAFFLTDAGQVDLVVGSALLSFGWLWIDFLVDNW